MAKEVLLYGEMYSWSARDFISAVEDAKGSDLSVRVNSMGGDVDYGYGMIAKFKEFEGKKSVKVDGSAASMAAFSPCTQTMLRRWTFQLSPFTVQLIPNGLSAMRSKWMDTVNRY